MTPIAGYTMLLKTPTLVIYQKDGENVMVIGVRGTADFRDFKAWFSTAFNVIPDSARFKEDIDVVARFQQEYPVSAYTYYATGHSLGGTLIDELIKKGMVKEARTYNPAIETSDIPDVALSQKNHRVYADGDPLYLLQGRFDHPAEVRNSYKYYPSSVYDFVPGYDKYKQHILQNPVFVGGKTKGKVEMKPQDYYAEHRNIVSLLDNTGKALQREAKDQKAEATKMAKSLGHTNPFYHLRGAGPKESELMRREIMGRDPAYEESILTAPLKQARIDADNQHIIDTERKRREAQQRALNEEAERTLEEEAKEGEYNSRLIHDIRSRLTTRLNPNPSPVEVFTLYRKFSHDRDGTIIPDLKGRGIMDDIKHGIQSVIGKPPVVAHKVWTPAEQSDINKRQRIIDVDKQREKMIASRVDYAFKNLMENAQRPNVLQAYYKSVGTDNVKDYTAKVKALATKAAEEFYPY
jgi:hypothetical protein